MLFHYFQDVWLDFFQILGVKTITSPPTNKEIVKHGIALAIDEACFSSKIYLGHVAWLLDRCDVIFVPRFENTAIREDYCPRIFGMYDVVKHTFPKAKLLNADVNLLYRKREQDAFVKIAQQLGFTVEAADEAYRKALEAAGKKHEEKLAKQQEIIESDGMKVLLVSHSYNLHDAYIGTGIAAYFEKNNIKVIYDDLVDTNKAKQKTKEIHGNRVYWKINSELMGGLELYKDKVDGIVLITTFPCGPDSIFNEMIIRKVKDKPILSLMVDELDATAGLQTRLESFVDILTAKQQGGSR